jgi:hypothetical protein
MPRRAAFTQDEALISASEAADILHISVRTLRGHVDDGSLRAISIGRGKKRQRLAFDPVDVRAFKLARIAQPCQSTNHPTLNISSTTSRSLVVDFTALQKQRAEEKRTRLNSKNATRPKP